MANVTPDRFAHWIPQLAALGERVNSFLAPTNAHAFEQVETCPEIGVVALPEELQRLATRLSLAQEVIAHVRSLTEREPALDEDPVALVRRGFAYLVHEQWVRGLFGVRDVDAVEIGRFLLQGLAHSGAPLAGSPVELATLWTEAQRDNAGALADAD